MSSGNSYHPTEHGGIKKDGNPDRRVKGEHVSDEPGPADQTHSAAQQHGDIYKPTEHGGVKKDGTRDRRVKDENVTEDAA
ncbi:hypothetical protein SpCBS45565_g05367 [Spizellomyces sp. 'palustris']|nr:hypothetical protein SpCBS45565_g05367 [Spizellomyces sp. 'palustris']